MQGSRFEVCSVWKNKCHPVSRMAISSLDIPMNNVSDTIEDHDFLTVILVAVAVAIAHGSCGT